MTSTFARPAVAVDVGGPDALGAVRWAAREAGFRDATVRLVRVLPLWCGGGAERDLDVAAHVVGAITPTAAVERVVAVGHVTARLTAESRTADLLVVGAGVRGGIRRALGAGPLALAGAAHCPVAVVPASWEAPDPALPVVVGVDGSPSDEAAISFAFDAAAARSAVLLAVHTWVDLVVDGSPADLADWNRISTEESAVLEERLVRSAAAHPEVVVERVCRSSSATRLLVELSRRAQLVVIGSHGHGRIAGHLVDAAGHGLARAAGCPWVIARTVQMRASIGEPGGGHRG